MGYKVSLKQPDGRHVYQVTKVRNYNQGIVMEYKNGSRSKSVVYVPFEYEYGHDGPDMIVYQIAGNSSASKFVDHKDQELREISIDPDCPGDDLSDLVYTDLIARGYKAMTKSWTWVIITVIGVVALIGVAILIYMGQSGGNGATA